MFSDKGIRAVVARWAQVSVKSNNPADLEGVKTVARCHAQEIVALDPKQNEMARIGTTHLVPIMNDFDLLPTHNFQYGSHPASTLIGRDAFEKLFDPGFDGCWKGCTVACAHGARDFVPFTGAYRGDRCSWTARSTRPSPVAGRTWHFRSYTILEMNFYFDAYGLDTISVGTSLAFAM